MSPSAGRIHSTAGEHPGGSDSRGDSGFTAVQLDLPAANSAGSHVSSHGPRPPLLCHPGHPATPFAQQVERSPGHARAPCLQCICSWHIHSLGILFGSRTQSLRHSGPSSPRGGSLGQLPGQRLSTGTDFSPQGTWGSFWGHLEAPQLGVGVLLASRGVRPGCCSTPSSAQNSPAPENDLALNVRSAEAEKLGSRH